MADRDNMSVDEILAACRAADGGGGGGGDAAAAPETEPSADTPAEPTQETVAKTPPAASTKSGGGRPSVAEMLAAARAEKSGEGGGDSDASKSPPQAESPPPASSQAASAGGKSAGGRPSVAEMMAMARGEKAGPAKDKPQAKPAAKPAAGKQPAAKSKPAAAADDAGPKDTASILAAARKPVRPGPMSKAEAAARGEAAAAPQRIVAPPMPEKPAYAQPVASTAEPNTTLMRRSVVLAMVVGSFLALGFSTFATTMGLWLLATARFMFPNILREPPSQFKVGFPGQFAPGQVETKFKAQFGVWVVRGEYQGQQQIYALKSVCTHLGCTPNWLEAEQKFKCPCHGSGFYKDGINFEGPAPRPLERYAISTADDGQLLIDKSRTFQEERGDWNDPASFVSV